MKHLLGGLSVGILLGVGWAETGHGWLPHLAGPLTIIVVLIAGFTIVVSLKSLFSSFEGIDRKAGGP